MSKTVSSPLAHLIRHVAVDPRMRDEPDQHLLQQFSSQRDEAAFSALVHRHGPMVLDVCRGVLGNETNAEDAFQATFLVLARKASSIRKLTSVGSWLHGVAYRTSLKARAQAATRHKSESKAPPRQATEPEDCTWHEIRQIVHEELTGITDRYRQPLVLCYLEGMTQDQAAGQLKLAKSTLKERLERGRALLRTRLVKRGLGPTALLLATAWPSAEAQASLTAALISSAMQIVGGSAKDASVSALANGALQTGLAPKLKPAALLLLAVALAAGAARVDLSALAAKNQPSTPEQPEALAQPLAEAADKKEEVHGQVFGPEGKPIAGAKLYLAYRGSKDTDYPVRATSGMDGRFTFRFSSSEIDQSDDDKPHIQVMATADGLGCDWAEFGSAKEDLILRLVQDLPVDGRILEPEGTPVAGAKVTIWGVSTKKNEDLNDYVKATIKGEVQALPKHWSGPLPGHRVAATTNADGRFRVTGLGRERRVIFWIESPGIAWASIAVLTRDSVPAGGSGRSTMFPASFSFVGSADRPVRGVVRDKETGKPIAGVSVGVPGNVRFVTRTDKDGQYELQGWGKRRTYALQVKPGDGQYFQRRMDFNDTPGLGPLRCDIELVRGLMVHGRITDKATGKPISGAVVDYHPLGGNTYVDKLLKGSWGPESEMTTGADGMYEITVLPGPGVMGVKAPKLGAYMPGAVPKSERKAFFKTPLVEDRDEEYLTRYWGAGSWGAVSPDFYNAMVLLEPNEKEEKLVRDVSLEQPLERAGHIVGPDGQPVTGATAYGLTRFGIETLNGDDFTVHGINPKAKRPLVFYHKEKQVGYYVKDLRNEPSESLVIKLQPCGSVSGRVIDSDGQPVAGLQIQVMGHALRVIGEAGGGLQEVTTDKEGRFRVQGLVPEEPYYVRDAGRNPAFPRVLESVQVGSGKHKELGDIKIKDRGQPN